MELSDPVISHVFSKKTFFIFWETELFAKTFYILGGNFKKPF